MTHIINIKRKAIGLVVAVMIMVIGSSMGLLLTSLLTTSVDTSVYYMKSTQALFSAESGAQYAVARLVNNSTYRLSPASYNLLTGTVGGTSFSVGVTNSSGTYVVTSTGTAGEACRIINQTVNITTSLPAAFDYALALFDPDDLSIGGSATIGNVTINSDVYYAGNNTLTIQKATTVQGTVYANNVAGYTGDQADSMPDPLPELPELDTSSYDSLIAVAGGMASDALTINNGDVESLSGTVYYTSLTLKNGGTISGSGTIVVTGDVDLQGGAVAPGIKIVANGTISSTGSATVGSSSDLSCVLYGKSGVSLGGGADIYGSIIVPVGVTATIGGSGNTKVTGIVYGDEVDFGGNAQVRGSIVANSYSSGNLNGNVAIVYDESYLPTSIPTGFTGEENIVVQDWGESY